MSTDHGRQAQWKCHDPSILCYCAFSWLHLNCQFFILSALLYDIVSTDVVRYILLNYRDEQMIIKLCLIINYIFIRSSRFDLKNTLGHFKRTAFILRTTVPIERILFFAFKKKNVVFFSLRPRSRIRRVVLP